MIEKAGFAAGLALQALAQAVKRPSKIANAMPSNALCMSNMLHGNLKQEGNPETFKGSSSTVPLGQLLTLANTQMQKLHKGY